MADVTLDIATKIVSPEQVIWSVFPGRGRRFLSQFMNEGVIFLDMPGLRLGRKALEDDRLLRRHVAMSLAWHDYYYGRTESVPSRNAEAYDPPRGASFRAEYGNVKNVFVRMKPGDLVLVGQQSLYERVYIGEVVSDFDPELTVYYDRYGRTPIPARKVHWLSVRQERRFLSQKLSLLLSNRKAVIHIDKEEFGDEIYKIAYGDYVFGSDARYVFEGPKYNNIAVSTVPGINLITYFAAAFNACELEEIDQFAALPVQKAIDNYFEQDDLYSFEIDFSSPGEYVLHARRAALPLLVATLVSATSGDLTRNDARAAEVTNTTTVRPAGGGAAQTDPSTIEIQDKYRAIMNAINADRYNELVKMNQEAKAGVGLKVRVKVRRKK